MHKKSKLFLTIFISVLTCFLIFHYTIWFFYTGPILNINGVYKAGNLARMGLTHTGLTRRKTYIDLPKTHIEIANYKNEKIDLITIGDSFSQGGGYGKNPYYQDYIASKQNLNVLNIPSSTLPDKTYSAIEIVYGMINSGLLDKLKPKAILIESVEDYVISRFKREQNDSLAFNYDDIIKISSNTGIEPDTEYKFINNANFKYAKNLFQEKFIKKNIENYVYAVNLKQDLFTSKPYNKTLWTKDDFMASQNINYENISQVNSELNKLAQKLKEHNITLYFMPVIGKYNLYYDYIIDPKKPNYKLFEFFREMPKEYVFVDTKEILAAELKNGVKDLYYSDDTHWTYKSYESIFNKVKF